MFSSKTAQNNEQRENVNEQNGSEQNECAGKQASYKFEPYIDGNRFDNIYLRAWGLYMDLEYVLNGICCLPDEVKATLTEEDNEMFSLMLNLKHRITEVVSYMDNHQDVYLEKVKIEEK